jgi:hypothetical protein
LTALVGVAKFAKESGYTRPEADQLFELWSDLYERINEAILFKNE